jgi:hypothetical protein
MVVAMETGSVMAASIGQAATVVKPERRRSWNFRSRPLVDLQDRPGMGGEHQKAGVGAREEGTQERAAPRRGEAARTQSATKIWWKIASPLPTPVFTP